MQPSTEEATTVQVRFTAHAKRRWKERIEDWNEDLAKELVLKSKKMSKIQRQVLIEMCPWREEQIKKYENASNYRINKGIVFICRIEDMTCHVITVYIFKSACGQAYNTWLNR